MWQLITGNKGIVGAIAGVIGLLVALNEYGDYKHEQGYQLAVSEINAQSAVKLNEANQAALNDIVADNTDTADRVRVEYITQTKIKEVIKYVDKEIIVPADCEPLASHVVSVLSQSTGVVNSATKSADTD